MYVKTKYFIKNNGKLLIFLVFIQLFFTLPLNFYVDKPGGITDISSKIEIKGKKEEEGSLNFAYVLEMRGTPFNYIIAKINKDYKIIKKTDIIYDNETIKDMNFRDHLLLEEANDNAIIVAFKNANKKLQIEEEKIFVTYIDGEAETDLKVEDQIIKINGIKIEEKNNIYEIINSLKEKDILNIKVKNKKKDYNRYAVIKKEKNKNVIGIMISTDKTIKSNPAVKIKKKKSESGPSGGLMMSLSVYNAISKEDITKGLKIVGTGTIDEDGNVGTIGGVEFKLKSAVKEKADIFLVPAGLNYKDAIKLKEQRKYDIEIKSISTFKEALTFLKSK